MRLVFLFLFIWIPIASSGVQNLNDFLEENKKSISIQAANINNDYRETGTQYFYIDGKPVASTTSNNRVRADESSKFNLDIKFSPQNKHQVKIQAGYLNQSEDTLDFSSKLKQRGFTDITLGWDYRLFDQNLIVDSGLFFSPKLGNRTIKRNDVFAAHSGGYGLGVQFNIGQEFQRLSWKIKTIISYLGEQEIEYGNTSLVKNDTFKEKSNYLAEAHVRYIFPQEKYYLGFMLGIFQEDDVVSEKLTYNYSYEPETRLGLNGAYVLSAGSKFELGIIYSEREFTFQDNRTSFSNNTPFNFKGTDTNYTTQITYLTEF